MTKLSDLEIDENYPASYLGTRTTVSGGGQEAHGTLLQFQHVPGTEFSRDPDGGQPEAEYEPVDSDVSLDWGTPSGNRKLAAAILRHYLGQEPTNAQIRSLLEECADTWSEDGDVEVTLDQLEAAAVL